MEDKNEKKTMRQCDYARKMGVKPQVVNNWIKRKKIKSIKDKKYNLTLVVLD